MTSLLPCPFCGGEAITRLADRVPFRGMLHSWYVTCMNDRCGCELGFYGMDENGTCGTYETEEEAITAWNTRAERTCHNLLGAGVFHCSECDMATEDWSDIGGEPAYGYNYCPNCGCRVLEDNDGLV